MKGLALILLLTTTITAQAESWCTDPETIKDWNERLAEHPQDVEFHKLHALWLGLCKKVIEQDFDQDVANILFESERTKLIKERMLQNKKVEKGA